MVLSNKGLVCIDELEKMNEEDRSTILGAMEQQEVSISKANVQATLRSQTAVLAAANPKFGHFNPQEDLIKQVKLEPPLLSRFDAKFLLLDIPDKKKDENIAAHILREHQQKNVIDELIDKDLLRKYISYAKQHYHPVLTEKASSLIKNFYVKLRNPPTFGKDGAKPIAITARQLEAILRFAEAAAKARLSKEVTEQDAQRAINIIKYSMMQTDYDEESGSFDVDKVSGNSASKRSKIFILKEILEELEERLGKLIPMEELEKAADGKLKQDELDEAVDKLVRSGDLFRPRKGYVQRM
jgi:replicative DNA helicase Mcm